MELKLKLEHDLHILKNKKEEVLDIFLKWVDFWRIPKKEINIKYIEDLFNKSLNNINDIQTALTDDLEDNYKTFHKFFMVGVGEGTESLTEIQNLLLYMIEIRKEDSEDKEDMKDNEPSLENLVALADNLYFGRFIKVVYSFYESLSKCLDDVFDYADKLYIHYTGDTTLCNTRT